MNQPYQQQPSQQGVKATTIAFGIVIAVVILTLIPCFACGGLSAIGIGTSAASKYEEAGREVDKATQPQVP